MPLINVRCIVVIVPYKKKKTRMVLPFLDSDRVCITQGRIECYRKAVRMITLQRLGTIYINL